MCPLMSGNHFIMQNNVRHDIAGGNCQSKGVIYVASCKECNMKYVGKTVNELRIRVSGHRNTFKSFQPRDEIEITDREALAAHTKGYHRLQDVTDFNNLFVWDIFRTVSNPSMLLTEEQQVINLLGTKHPLGLNISNPIGLSSYLIHRVWSVYLYIHRLLDSLWFMCVFYDWCFLWLKIYLIHYFIHVLRFIYLVINYHYVPCVFISY